MRIKLNIDKYTIISLDSGGDPYFEEVELSDAEFATIKHYFEKFWTIQAILKEKLEMKKH